MPLFGHRYSKLQLADIKRHLIGLDLEVVGGLRRRGWTINDIDVIGDKKDILTLVERLKKNGIQNPVHYCGKPFRHSHIFCAYYGIKLVLTGKGY